MSTRPHPGDGPALVVAAILVDDLDRPTRLLAARRRTPLALAGRWEFPGGKVERGEHPCDALRRELREELQVSVTLGAELVGPAEGRWPISDAYRMRIWWATVAAGSPVVTGGHDELRWLRGPELSEVAWLDADLAVIEALEALPLTPEGASGVPD